MKMTDEQFQQKARQIAAGVCDMEGGHPDYTQLMREGAYDKSERVVITAHAALRYGFAEGERAAKKRAEEAANA